VTPAGLLCPTRAMLPETTKGSPVKFSVVEGAEVLSIGV